MCLLSLLSLSYQSWFLVGVILNKLTKKIAFANPVSRYQFLFYMGEFFSLQMFSSMILIAWCIAHGKTIFT